MEDLIRSSGDKSITIEHNGKEIKIRPAFPRKVRKLVTGLASKYKDIDLDAIKAGSPAKADLEQMPGFSDDSDETLYEILAVMCLAPYNDAAAWRYFDENTGEAEIVFNKVKQAVQEAQAAAVAFRKESPGSSTR
ncbi:MAG: hypothetical protein WAK45_11575 [Methanoregula sp.]|uniref:hypothetical protein n=1 Tax=Methanoregula sp. TaxID=2052170 RepID=UPI003BB1CA0B